MISYASHPSTTGLSCWSNRLLPEDQPRRAWKDSSSEGWPPDDDLNTPTLNTATVWHCVDLYHWKGTCEITDLQGIHGHLFCIIYGYDCKKLKDIIYCTVFKHKTVTIVTHYIYQVSPLLLLLCGVLLCRLLELEHWNNKNWWWRYNFQKNFRPPGWVLNYTGKLYREHLQMLALTWVVVKCSSGPFLFIGGETLHATGSLCRGLAD